MSVGHLSMVDTALGLAGLPPVVGGHGQVGHEEGGERHELVPLSPGQGHPGQGHLQAPQVPSDRVGVLEHQSEEEGGGWDIYLLPHSSTLVAGAHLPVGHDVAGHDGQLLQDVDEQLHRAASPPLVKPLVMGETGVEVSEKRQRAEAGEGVVPGVLAHLDDPGGEGGLGAGQLDGGQLPVHLQIHSHRKAFCSQYLAVVVDQPC